LRATNKQKLLISKNFTFMKKFDLSAYGVSEMNQQELIETDGGGPITALIVGIACLVAVIVAAVAVAAVVDDNCDTTVTVTNGESGNSTVYGGCNE
jgi:hypothetical protein